MAESVILAVDPDQTVLSFVRRTVLEAGHLFCGARRGADALRKGREVRPSAALVRMGVADMSGRELVTRLRAEIPSMPLLLTARKGEESEITAGLELGAVNCLIFPFGDDELLERLGAMLRWEQAPRGEGVVELGDLLVDLDRGRLLRPREQSLTASELEVLRRLLDPPGRAVTRRQIPVGTDRAVDVHVASLRAKMGASGRCIQTLRGIGYRFWSAACL